MDNNTPKMLVVSRDILLKTQKELEINGFQSAVAILCDNGMDQDEAQSMVTGLQTQQGDLDSLVLDIMMSILPLHPDKAEIALSTHYGISRGYSSRKVQTFLHIGNFSKDAFKTLLRGFNPTRVKDVFATQPKPISSLTSHILKLMVENQMLKAISYLKHQTKCSDDEVEVILDKLSPELKHID